MWGLSCDSDAQRKQRVALVAVGGGGAALRTDSLSVPTAYSCGTCGDKTRARLARVRQFTED